MFFCKMFNDKIKTGQHCGKKQQHAPATRLSEGEGGGAEVVMNQEETSTVYLKQDHHKILQTTLTAWITSSFTHESLSRVTVFASSN